MTSSDRLNANELKTREQELTAELEKTSKELHAEILERKRVEEELHHVAEQRRLALEIAELGTWEYDVASGLTRWDERCSEIFGLTYEQAHTQDRVLALVNPEDRQRVIADISAALDLAGPGIYDTEYRIQREDGTERWVAVRGRAFWRDKEQKLKPAQFLGTLMDITERKKAEEALKQAYQDLEEKVKERTAELEEAYNLLRESEERYRSLYESSLDGILLSKPDGTIFSANPQACKLFGMTKYEIIQAGREGLVVKDEKFVSALRERESTGQVKAEITFRQKNGSIFIGETCSSPFKDIYGSTKTSLTIRDITERKREERRIQRYNNVLRAINRVFGSVVRAETEEELENICLSVAIEITNSQIGFVDEMGPDGILHDVAISDMGWFNCKMYDKTGHRRPPGDFLLHGLYGRVIDSGNSFFTNDPSSHPDSIGLPEGHLPLTSFLGAPLILDGKTMGILAVANREDGYSLEQQEDLEAIAPAVAHVLQRKYEEQQRKRTEKALHKSEERFRALLTATSEVIYRMNPDWSGMNRLCGRGFLADTENPSNNWLQEYILPEDHPRVTVVINEAIRTKSMFKLEHRVRQADGSIGWTYSRAVPILDENREIAEWFGAASDITERKRMEEALKKSESSLAEAQHIARIGSWEWNIRTGEVCWSKELYSIYGVDPNTFNPSITSFASFIHPDDREPMSRIINKILSGDKSTNFDFRIISADGSMHILNVIGKITDFDENGDPCLMVGTNQDITESKQAEEALRKSKERYQTLFSSISEGFAHYKAIYDEHGKLYDLLVLEINPAGASFSGVEREAQIGKTWREVWPDVEDYLFKIYNEVDQTGRSFRFEHLVNITGRWYVNQVDRIEKGQLVVTFTDITERKIAEQNLRLSEERYRSFIEKFGGIAFQIDENFNLEFIHGAVKEIIGYSAEEFFSNISWRQLVVPEDMDIFLKAEEKAAQSPGDYQGKLEYRIRTKDGKIKWMHEFHQKISRKSGRPEKYTGIIYDITEKKESEETLAKFEIARQKELHHRIKNNLQVISSLLDLAADKFNNRKCIENTEVIEAFRESQNRVISIAFIHKELHEGRRLDALNFSLYLDKLTENLFQTYKVGNLNISLNLDLEENVFFNMDIAIPLGMIVNELVSNSFKYAFAGRDKGTIQIKLFSGDIKNKSDNKEEPIEKSTGYTLIVSDNGIGIPENFDFENSDTLGMQLVNILVDQLDGEIELKRDQGTTFIVRFSSIEK